MAAADKKSPQATLTPRGSPMSDVRDTYLGQVVAGKSFADVGGLWGTVNEKVSVAHAHGARTLTMIDISPPENVLWERFEDRRQTLRLPEVQAISGDVQTLAETSPELRFEVVHCSGVLYHMPEPVRFLRALRTITTDTLVLTSAVTATRVTGEDGTLEVPAAAVLCIPSLTRTRAGDRAIVLARCCRCWRVRTHTGAGGVES